MNTDWKSLAIRYSFLIAAFGISASLFYRNGWSSTDFITLMTLIFAKWGGETLTKTA